VQATELVQSLAQALRDHVAPSLGAYAGRTPLEAGVGGDVTFAIDRDAEVFLEQFLREHAPGTAFYSEDRGLVVPGSGSSELPAFAAKQESASVLLVDPIDGTRPALAGFESCCVSVAEAEIANGEPTMGDVRAGCIVEIKSGIRFTAERGAGVEIRNGADLLEPQLSPNEDLRGLFWTAGFRGRPAAPLVEVIGELIDTSSVRGGFFDLGSATFDMTRILTGQLDAYLDVGSLMIDRLPALRSRFEEVGGGAVLNNSPYDLAAAVLCLEEGGAVVSDAAGESLNGKRLLGSGHEFQMSCVAASNPGLHSDLIGIVQEGIRRLLAKS
jgi:myo-inositol-1(or 4)-monophosphatase